MSTVFISVALLLYVVAAALCVARARALVTRFNVWIRWFTRIGVVFHLCGMGALAWTTGQWPLTGLADALSALSVLVIINYIALAATRPKLDALGDVLIPLGAALLATSRFVPSSPVPALSGVVDMTDAVLFPLHTVMTFLGLTALFVAFALGVAYLTVRRRLKAKQLEGITSLPALEVLDRIHFRFQLIGFVALTLGIVFGAFWANMRLGPDWVSDPKIVSSMLIWMWYALAVQTRLALGWRGRAGVLFSVLGFVGVVVSLVGVTLLFSGWHGVAGLG